MKVCLYLRVSKEEQNLENQRDTLTTFCNEKGYQIVKIYEEKVKGSENNRPEFKRMLKDAENKTFDTILVWDYSRFTREGLIKASEYYNLLNKIGVNLICYKQPFFNTGNELTDYIIRGVVSEFAKQERNMISERTKASLKVARSKGRMIGRRSLLTKEMIERIRNLHEQHKSYSIIAKELGINKGSVFYAVKNDIVNLKSKKFDKK